MEEIKHNNILYKQIKDFPDYYISKCGKVISLRVMKIGKDKAGYSKVDLCSNGKKNTKTIHKLVGLNWINNKYNKKFINHKDGNKSNNNIDNLEWCTQSENEKHKYKVLKHQIWNKGKFGKLNVRSKKVKQLDLNNNFIKTWDSMMDIQRDLNICYQGISKCCRKEQETSGGFKWEYL